MSHLLDERRYLIPFRATLLPQIFTDVLIVGAGVAGMRAALEASQHSDVIVTHKGELQQSNTYLAQGGIAAVLDPADTFEQHVDDTLEAGAGLCDHRVVRQVVEGAPDRIRELVKWGMAFDRAESDEAATAEGLALGREGGHGMRRILHSQGDATGKSLTDTLAAQVESRDNIRLFDHCFVLDLITEASARSRCLGAVTHHPRYGLQVIWAGATILATGGCGQVFRESTNPQVATGDGLAMAYRAGAALADMAFVQFHPTTLYVAGASRSLITEAVRGEGAHLIDRNEHRFMADYDAREELAPRDIVSRAILAQMAKTGSTNVFLDCRHMGADRFAHRFPGIFALLKNFDLDPSRDWIPIHPSAHYMVGGVKTDENCRTNLGGLYACGEVASTGLHGANRLASNSLLEGLVCGQIAGRDCEQLKADSKSGSVKIVSDIRPSDRSELDLADVRSSLRSVMWRHVGIQRDGARLAEVQEMFDFWMRYTLDKIFDERVGWEVQNLLLVGALITRAAAFRCESRGTHHRIDHPEPEDAFLARDIWVRGDEEAQLEPVAGSEQRATSNSPAAKRSS
jgi:L-aspartate oxidase